MSNVKSTYNFVPAPSENDVYKPEWAKQVSHDIPFSDGESGEIEIKITAETPIFIRNGHKKGVEDNEFSHYVDENGKKVYFIPGSSLKGMFRNVLEIMSFSRMKQVDNHHHAIRQIMKTKGTVIDEGYKLVDPKIKKEINAGYLQFKNGKYILFDCGKPYKIRYTTLDEKLNTSFGMQFGKEDKSNSKKNFSARTGAYKYKNVLKENSEKDFLFELHPLDGEKEKSWVSGFQPLKYVRFTDNKNDTFWGRIVCVGQASTYDVSTSRRGEYVFKGKKEEILLRKYSEVDKDVINAFLFINRDRKSDELADWTFWKSKIEEGIPVFYRKEKDKNGIEYVVELGLSFMYKQPVNYTIKNAEPKFIDSQNVDFNSDLSDVVFGQVDSRNPLKGRVFVSHALAVGFPVSEDERSYVMGSPKSSFVPFYLNQKGVNGKTAQFNTYNTVPILRGFKRYPIHKSFEKQILPDVKEDMETKFKTLPAGTFFEGKVRFHNLRPIEIGALISSITLHFSNNVFHSIGLAKPFGFGRVSIEVNSQLRGVSHSVSDYMKKFEIEMRLHNQTFWESALNELLLMSTLQNSEVESSLKYEELKSFQEIKKKGLYLRRYSEIAGHKNVLQFLVDNSEIEKAKQEQLDFENKRSVQVNSIINQIKCELSNYNFDSANLHYERLKNIGFDSEYPDYETEVNTRKEEEKEEIIIKSAHNALEQARIASNKIPLWDKIAEKDNFKNVFGNVKAWMRDNEVQSLDDADFNVLVEKLASLYSLMRPNDKKQWSDFRKWSDLAKVIGEDAAQKVFNQIVV